MKALTWQGKRQVTVEDVPDPVIQEPTDAIVKITSTAICGSDLHLYEVLGPYIDKGSVLGHEPMGVVEEVGSAVTHLRPGDRVVVPFNISCGHCFTCQRQLFAQCETTQNRDTGKGASLFGYTNLYGGVPGGQAEYLRVPQAQFGPIKVPDDRPDEHWLYLSDVVSTAWQGVRYADVPKGGTLAVLGLGPIGLVAVSVAKHLGIERVIGVDLVPERLLAASERGAEVVDLRTAEPTEALLELTGGRGPDSVLEAVGMEAHGDAPDKLAQTAVGLLPDALARPLIDAAAVDRMAALNTAFKSCRRGGTVSISGVYGGEKNPTPWMEIFDRGLQLRMGQAHVRRWTDETVPVLMQDGDPLGVDSLATHRLPLAQAPHGYDIFQKKEDGCIKVVLTP